MSDAIIKVENLSKSYMIRHAGSGFRYVALRDVMAKKARQMAGILTRPAAALKKSESFQKREEFWALKDVALEIKQGERVGIIGRNGAGKSTLLKILSRIIAPTKGTIDIYGRVGSLLEVGTGFHPELTGRENIFLNGAILGMKNSEIRKKFDEIVAFAEVEKFLDTPVKRYSSGMYVRLAFAVAAHLEPEILIVDEVLAVGDAQFQKKCLGKMGEVSKNEGRTVLFVSHNMMAIRSLCEKVVLLEAGRIKRQGETKAVVKDYLEILASIHERVWENPESAPGNDKVRFHRAKISVESAASDGAPIRVDTPLQLEFEFWNYLEGAELNFSMHVYNYEGLLLFNSGSPAKKYSRGLVTGKCHIPANLLNDEKYSVMMMIVIDRSRAIYTIHDLLRFEVADRERDSGWMGKWGGVLRPMLQWETN